MGASERRRQLLGNEKVRMRLINKIKAQKRVEAHMERGINCFSLYFPHPNPFPRHFNRLCYVI